MLVQGIDCVFVTCNHGTAEVRLDFSDDARLLENISAVPRAYQSILHPLYQDVYGAFYEHVAMRGDMDF